MQPLARAALALLVGAVAAFAPQPAQAVEQTLKGRTIVLDPGHNGRNGANPGAINRLVGIGGGRRKACDTTGAATNSGYSEAAFNWDVALRARRILRNRGATVVLTRQSNRGVGPCIDERARIVRRAGADVAVSIHADGAPPGARGFHVISPALIDGLTDDVHRTSRRLAVDVRRAFRQVTRRPYASYIGRNGLDRRGDLGGLRLADVPTVFIETGNMRNAAEARLMTRGSFRLRAARGIARGVDKYLNK